MQFSFLGMKFTLGIVLLIIFLYWLMWGHVLYSCSNGSSMKEAFNTSLHLPEYSDNDRNHHAPHKVSVTITPVEDLDYKSTPEYQRSLPAVIHSKGSVGYNQLGVAESASNPGTRRGGKRVESFTGANTNYGESSKFSLTMGNSVDTSSWFTPNLTYAAGTTGSKGVQNILNRQQQPVPLPEGELLMFANTPFKPECCPNAYSNSTGCACMTVDQYNYLINRGGNNVPYSEY